MRVRDKTHYRTHAFKGTPETAGDVQDDLDTRQKPHAEEQTCGRPQWLDSAVARSTTPRSSRQPNHSGLPAGASALSIAWGGALPAAAAGCSAGMPQRLAAGEPARSPHDGPLATV